MRGRGRLWMPMLVAFVVLAAACAAEEADTRLGAEDASKPVPEQVDAEAAPESVPDAVYVAAPTSVADLPAGATFCESPLGLSGCDNAVYSSAAVQQARDICESRGSNTELRANADRYICYEVTVLDDGWRLCDASRPLLAVPTETVNQSKHPCGNAGPRGAVEEAAVEEARRECEARNGHTEFLPVDDRYSCFEITVLDDGWRTCAWSVPYLTVITETAEPEYPCGTPGPEWPFFVDEAPSDCEAARDWYADYYRSVIDEMERIVDPAETPNGAAVQLRLSDLGHIFEQNGRRAEAAQASCATGDSLGIAIGIAEARDGLDEGYESVVVGCVTDGIHDCTALAPTAKAECETLDPEFVYLLDSFMLENGWLESWPHVAASGCSLRGQ